MPIKEFRSVKAFLRLFPKTTLLSSVLTVSGADLLVRALGFAVLPLYLNSMSPASFGEFTYIFSIIAVLPPLISLSLYISHNHLGSEKFGTDECKRIFFSTLVTASLVPIFCTLILVTTGATQLLFDTLNLSGEYQNVKSSLFLANVVIATSNLILLTQCIVSRISQRLILYSFLKFFLVNCFSLIFVVFNFLSMDETTDRLFGVLVGEICIFAVFVFVLRREFLFKFDHNYIFTALRSSLPLTTATFLSILSSLSDRFFISQYFSFDEFAVYSLAVILISPVPAFSASLMNVAAPYLFATRDLVSVHRNALKAGGFLAIIICAYVCLIFFTMILAITLNLVPKTYANTNKIFVFLSFGMVASCGRQYFEIISVKLRKPSTLLLVSFVQAMLMVVCCAILVPNIGLTGVLFSHFLSNVLGLAVIWQRVHSLISKRTQDT